MVPKKIQQYFSKLTGTNYYYRIINFLEGDSEKMDQTYDELIRHIYYYTPERKEKLLLIAEIFEKFKADTSALSKASYLYAINYKRDKSIELIKEVLLLEIGKNVDSWVDLGLFLRKIPRYEDISVHLLLNIEETMKQYNNEQDILSFLEKLYGKKTSH